MTHNLYQEEAKRYLMNTYARYPLTLVKGEGAYVWDIDGKKYLDFLSGIGCTALGHRHPAVEKAIIEQTQRILHTSNLYYSPPSIDLAKAIVEHGGLGQLFFCNSGTEANEAAIKLARKYQWRKGHPEKNIILSAKDAFHGRTLGSLAATAKTQLQEGFGPMQAGFECHSWDDAESFVNAIHEKVAAVILEPIQGESGIHVASSEFLKKVRTMCDEKDVLLIFDEVQCGLGRTGELFAYQYMGVVPDIITLAKGIANGLPLGAVCAKQEVANAFMPRDHGSTFGGNPVSCAAALASLTVLTEGNMLPRIKILGQYLQEGLLKLQHVFPSQVKAVRGVGLMIGVEFAEKPTHVLTHCREQGLLVNITGDNVLRMLPPFIITESDIDFVLSVIHQALAI